MTASRLFGAIAAASLLQTMAIGQITTGTVPSLRDPIPSAGDTAMSSDYLSASTDYLSTSSGYLSTSTLLSLSPLPSMAEVRVQENGAPLKSPSFAEGLDTTVTAPTVERPTIYWGTVGEKGASYMSRGSALMKSICLFCAEACDRCAEECSRHEADHCKRCAESCRNCAEECRKMAA